MPPLPLDNSVIVFDRSRMVYEPSDVVLEGEAVGSRLTVVAGGSVNLNAELPNGSLVGYRVESPTTIQGVAFSVGTYVFERNTSVSSGWTYRTLPIGSEVGGTPPEPTLEDVITALSPDHYWPLETSLTASAGGMSLTNFGDVSFTDAMATFNGTSQRLEGSGPLPHDGATALSFLAKIRLSADLPGGANYGIFSNPFSTSMGIYDTYHWAFENVGAVNGNAIWTAGEHLVGWTWDGAEMRLYRDGVLDATRAKSGAWPAVDAGNKFTIGGRAGSSTFTGDIAHMAAWRDVVLTDADMLSVAQTAGVA